MIYEPFTPRPDGRSSTTRCRTRWVSRTGAHILVGGTTASNIDVSAKLSSALPIPADHHAGDHLRPVQ